MVFGMHALVLVLLNALAVSRTLAKPLSEYGYTPGDTITYTDRNRHPAFAGPPAPDMPQPVSAGDAKNLTRRLETATHVDLSRLSEFLGQDVVVNIDTLQSACSQGQAPTAPWPGDYCPAFQDSINFQQYPDEPSTSEKYATAFGLDVQSFMKQVSRVNGIDMCDSCARCHSDDDCSGDDVCAKHPGEDTGTCMPIWWGSCHAWAPAAILEPEPKCPVTVGNVTFQITDLKKLLTMSYDGRSLPVCFTGTRYDGSTDFTDDYNRYVADAERDLCAGYFHIAVCNIMGLHKKSFIIDIKAPSDVWNQPVVKYEIQEMVKLDPRDAMNEYFGHGDGYTFNPAASQVAYVKTALSYTEEDVNDGAIVDNPSELAEDMTTKIYEYLLELDTNNDIIGGEWVGDSRTDHCDFLWIPQDKPTTGTTSIGIDYGNVQDLLAKSLQATC